MYPFFIYFPCNIIYSIYIHIYSTALVHLFQHFHSVSLNEYNTIPSFIHYIWIFRGLQYFAIPKKYCSEHSFICSLWTCDRFPVGHRLGSYGGLLNMAKLVSYWVHILLGKYEVQFSIPFGQFFDFFSIFASLTAFNDISVVLIFLSLINYKVKHSYIFVRHLDFIQ